MAETERLLALYGIDTSRWGTGSTKTLDHLKKEVAQGESYLQREPNKLVRVVTVLYVTVECHLPNATFRLREDRQEFHDGRVRRRDYLSGSLAEKIKVGETVNEQAVQRALQEELGINRFQHAQQITVHVSEEDSPSYLGLHGRFANHIWKVKIWPDDFRAEGYTEIQPDKTTYFVWDKLPTD